VGAGRPGARQLQGLPRQRKLTALPKCLFYAGLDAVRDHTLMPTRTDTSRKAGARAAVSQLNQVDQIGRRARTRDVDRRRNFPRQPPLRTRPCARPFAASDSQVEGPSGGICENSWCQDQAQVVRETLMSPTWRGPRPRPSEDRRSRDREERPEGGSATSSSADTCSWVGQDHRGLTSP
jgi:hypothetical protein